MDSGFVRTDGGREAAGFKGQAGDCVCRAIVIVTGRPYAEVYKELADLQGSLRKTKRLKKVERSARNGISTDRKAFKEYMKAQGFRWVPTMKVGQGCKVHLRAEELPKGRLCVAVSRHWTAVIDGVIHDTYDPRREERITFPNRATGALEVRVGRRCVYGYWVYEPAMIVRDIKLQWYTGKDSIKWAGDIAAMYESEPFFTGG